MIKDNIVIFIGYRWASAMDLRAYLVEVLGNIKGVEVLYDLKDIEVGEKIHEKISHCIDICDCYITNAESLMSYEVTAEVIMAQERGKFIVTLHEGDKLKPYPNHLPFLHDKLHLLYIGFDGLKREVVNWLSSKTKDSFEHTPVAVRNIQKEVNSFQSGFGPYQKELLRRILDETLQEIKEIRSSAYTLNVGFEKNFLFRSRAIFSTAINVSTPLS